MDENEKLPDVLRLKVDVILEPIRKWWDGQDGRGAYFGSLEDARENLNHRVDIARDEIIKFGTDMFRLGREMLEKQQADHQKDLGDLSGLGQIPDPEPLKPGLGMEHALLRIEKAISNTPKIEITPPIAIEVGGNQPAIYRFESIQYVTKAAPQGNGTGADMVIAAADYTRTHNFPTAEERDGEYDRIWMLLMMPIYLAGFPCWKKTENPPESGNFGITAEE